MHERSEPRHHGNQRAAPSSPDSRATPDVGTSLSAQKLQFHPRLPDTNASVEQPGFPDQSHPQIAIEP